MCFIQCDYSFSNNSVFTSYNVGNLSFNPSLPLRRRAGTTLRSVRNSVLGWPGVRKGYLSVRTRSWRRQEPLTTEMSMSCWTSSTAPSPNLSTVPRQLRERVTSKRRRCVLTFCLKNLVSLLTYICSREPVVLRKYWDKTSRDVKLSCYLLLINYYI